MLRLFVLALAAFSIAVVYGNLCHVTNDDSSLHCGEVNNMSCKSVNYDPYCHKIHNDGRQMNGVCSCEKYCFDVSECTDGCYHSHPVCKEAYTGSIVKICVCVR